MNIINLSNFAMIAILASILLLGALLIIWLGNDKPVVQPQMTTVDIDIIFVDKNKNFILNDNSKELANSTGFNTLLEAETYVATLDPSVVMSSCPEIATRQFNVTCYHPEEDQLDDYVTASKDPILSNASLNDLPTIVLGGGYRDQPAQVEKKYYVAYTKCN
jgi:hypothetical protein